MVSLIKPSLFLLPQYSHPEETNPGPCHKRATLATLLLKVLFSDKNQSGVITRKYEVRDRQEDLIHVSNLYPGLQMTAEVTIN